MRFLRTNLIFLLHKEPALTAGLLAALGSPTPNTRPRPGAKPVEPEYAQTDSSL